MSSSLSLWQRVTAALPRHQTLQEAILYIAFWGVLVSITLAAYLNDADAQSNRAPVFASAALSDTTPVGLNVAVTIKSIDPVAATCLLGFTLSPTNSLLWTPSKGGKRLHGREAPTATSAVASLAGMMRPRIAQAISVQTRGFRRNYTAKSPLPNEETVTVPFSRSSIRGYPFDTHTGFFDFSARVLPLPSSNITTRAVLPVHLTVDTRASGFKFVPGFPRVLPGTTNGGPLFVEVEFSLQRSNITVGFSLFIIALNWILSLIMGHLALQVLVENRAVPAGLLTPPISLLFALPSLRNVQPAAPPVGATNDVVGFFWNMVIVALSAMVIMGCFIFRWHKPSSTTAAKSSQVGPAPVITAPTDMTMTTMSMEMVVLSPPDLPVLGTIHGDLTMNAKPFSTVPPRYGQY
ncbi:hypothetical protein GGF32_010096 [Allomyces javanicus]|nr:hypothetical protein GGF32_010096 [Allomyces javanicus]